jgi:hypothetical protein
MNRENTKITARRGRNQIVLVLVLVLEGLV